MAIGNITKLQIPPYSAAVIWWQPTFTGTDGVVRSYTPTAGYGSGTGGAGTCTVTFTLTKSDKTTSVTSAAGVWNGTLNRWEFRLAASFATPDPNSYSSPAPYYLKATLNDTGDSINAQPATGANWLVAVVG